MKTYRFKMPATIYIGVKAPDEETARTVAEEWQSHANGWEYFADDDDPDSTLDLEHDCEVADAMAHVDMGEVVRCPTGDDDLDEGAPVAACAICEHCERCPSGVSGRRCAHHPEGCSTPHDANTPNETA